MRPEDADTWTVAGSLVDLEDLAEAACHGGCMDSHRATPRCSKTRPTERDVSLLVYVDCCDVCDGIVVAEGVIPLLAALSCDWSAFELAQVALLSRV